MSKELEEEKIRFADMIIQRAQLNEQIQMLTNEIQKSHDKIRKLECVERD